VKYNKVAVFIEMQCVLYSKNEMRNMFYNMIFYHTTDYLHFNHID